MGARVCEPQHLKRHESRACYPNRAERGGKDQVEVASDDFCESILGVLPGVSRKQLQVVIAHFHKHIVATWKTGTKNGGAPIRAGGRQITGFTSA